MRAALARLFTPPPDDATAADATTFTLAGLRLPLVGDVAPHARVRAQRPREREPGRLRGVAETALAVVLAAQIGYSALLQIPPTSRYYDALLFLRGLLQVIRETLQWVSPLALLSQGLDATFRGSWHELLLYVASGVGGAVVWLFLAVWALARRGVLP